MKIYSLLYLRITYFPPLSASCNCFKHRSIFLSLTCEPYLDDEQGSNRNGKQGCVSNVKTEVESSLVISSLTFSFLDSFTFSTFSLISPLANLRYVYATLNKPRLIEPRFFYRTSKRIELSLATAVQFFVQLPLRLIFISSASSAWQQLLQLAHILAIGGLITSAISCSLTATAGTRLPSPPILKATRSFLHIAYTSCASGIEFHFTVIYEKFLVMQCDPQTDCFNGLLTQLAGE